jgi:hypothetical protein
MGFRVASLDLGLYRLIKGGDTGLNLSLSDLMDKRIELPNLWDIVKTLFTKKKIEITVKAYPSKIIDRLIAVQKGVDREIEKEISKAKSGGAM